MNIQESTKRALQTLASSVPILIGVLLLINLLLPLMEGRYEKIFSGNSFFDPLIGAALGSVSFGIPVTSYVVGGELLGKGVSLLAVTAFLLAWTTVGFAMLPLEISNLGKRFAIVRNLLNFVFAIVIAVLVVMTLDFLGFPLL